MKVGGLGDGRYTNWIKDSLALMYTKECLETIVDKRSEVFHGQLKVTLGTRTCSASCSSEDLTIKKEKWVVKNCPGVCQMWLDLIIAHHCRQPIPKLATKNTNPKLWQSDIWEVMKVYQPFGCQGHHSARDADIAALIDLMRDCDHFSPLIIHQLYINEVMSIRNRIMHSKDFLVENQDLSQDLKNQLDFLRSLTTGLSALSDNENQAVEEAIRKIEQLRINVLDLTLNRELELKAIKAKQVALETDMKILEQTMIDARADTATVTAEMQALQTRLDSQLSMIHDVKNDMSSQQQSTSGVIDNLTQLQQQFDILKRDIDETQKTTTSLKQQITEVEITSQQQEDTISTLYQRQQATDTELQSQKQCSQAHSSQLEQHGAEIATHTAHLGDHEARLQAQETIQESHKRILGCQEAKSAKRLRLESIQQKQRRKRSSCRDIQQHLMSLYKKECQNVAIYPLQPEWRTHVASLFVLPSMKLTNPRGISKHHIIGEDEESENVTSIEDIFPPVGSNGTDIYIIGDAGIGKSTLCEYLVHLWVRCHSLSYQATYSEEKCMTRFNLLFYISLREATSYSVEKMIEDQLQLEDMDVARLLYDHSSLVILDGLDEYSLKQTSKKRFGSKNLPYRRHSDKCTVLTTSRPWKLELLTTELGSKIDRHISIVGLHTDSQKKLIQKCVNLLNSEKNRDKNPTDFITKVLEQKLDKFMKTPILLMQMLGLWFSGESLGGSKCTTYAKLIDKQMQFTEEVRGFPTALQKAVPIIQEVCDEEKSQPDLFSMFLKNYSFILRYKNLLQKISKFAFCSLSSKDKENSLVFGHEQMELFNMSRDEMLLCLELGLLTQYKVFGEITQRLKSVSFIHKSQQEFLAAIYLSQLDQASELKQLIDRHFISLQHILEMETVFMFVCGMNPAVASDITRIIMDKASGDVTLEQYRQLDYNWFTSEPKQTLVKQLQGMILAGIEEGKQNGHTITDMQLQDLNMDVTDKNFPPARVLPFTGSLDLSHVKSLVIRDKGTISRDILHQLLKETSTSLHKVVLWDTVVSVEMIKRVVQQQQGGLQTLGLINESVDNVDFSHLNLHDLHSILSAPTHSLLLNGIVLTHTQLESLCHHVSHSCYGVVLLGKLQCITHGYEESECKQRLDLSANKNLSRLWLFQMSVQEVLFVPDNLVQCVIRHLSEPVATRIISCLKRAKKLEVLYCVGLRGSTVAELAATLPHLPQLQHIALVGINLCGQQQIVPAVAKLKKIEVIQLGSVTMKEDEMRELLAALPTSHRVRLLLGTTSSSSPVTITGCNRHQDLLRQIRQNPQIRVIRDEVEGHGEKCTVKTFWFETKKK